MKKLILIIAVMCNSIFANDWKFITFPAQLPTDYTNGINTRRDFLFNYFTNYKSNFVFAHPFDGFTIYTGKEWKFYTPKRIRELIENKDATVSLNLNNISMFVAITDSINNLWMSSYNAIFRYRDDPEKIHIYRKVKTKNGKIITPYYINKIFQDNGNIYSSICYFDSTENQGNIIIKYFIYDFINDEFVEKYDTEIGVRLYETGTTLIDKDGSIYNNSNLVSFEYQQESTHYTEIFRTENDTIIKFWGKYFIKFYQGNLVNVDSTLDNYTDSYHSPSRFFYNNKILYIYCTGNGDFRADTNIIYHFILTHNCVTGKVDTIKIPYLFTYRDKINNKKVSFANEIKLNDDGKIVLTFPGFGIAIYDPNSSVTEGDEDLMFVVGVNVHKMYPNPTSDRCHIDFFLNRLHVNNIKVQISDINGKIYKDISKDISYNSSTQDASLDFSVADIPQGNYYVLFTTSKNKQMRGLLILK